VDQAGTYTITVTNSTNGCTATDSVTVVNGPAPVASFSANPTSGIAPLTVDFTNGSTNATSYIWTFGDGNNSILSDPSNTFTSTGSYTVILIASSGSCVDTAEETVVVYDDFSLIIPNIFTPNGDNSNDNFTMKETGLKKIHGEIYDRWGLKLFEWDTPGIEWDGRTSSGTLVPVGTYFYIINASGFDDKEHTYKGYIQLLR
jgi:gliding motility-associated-like protein